MFLGSSQMITFDAQLSLHRELTGYITWNGLPLTALWISLTSLWVFENRYYNGRKFPAPGFELVVALVVEEIDVHGSQKDIAGDCPRPLLAIARGVFVVQLHLVNSMTKDAEADAVDRFVNKTVV
jgi:hypothetical protein